MNELQLFKHNDFGEFKILVVDGKVLFPATECAKVLGYSNPHKAISDHCRSLTKREVPHPQNISKKVQVNYISEGDLFRLIIRSKLPAAERFESWVFDEVLPTLRRTGEYRVQPQPTTTPLSYYQGNPVMLLKEIAVVLNKSVWTVRQHIHKLKENVDYLVLAGRSLIDFKVENSHISERIHAALTIVLESGIRKLASALGLDAPVLDSRLTLLPVAKPRATTGSSKPYRKSSVAELIRIYQEEFGKKPEPKVVAFLLLFEEYEEFGFKQGFNECRQLYEPGAPALR